MKQSLKSLLLFNIWMAIALETIGAMSHFCSSGSILGVIASAFVGVNLFLVYMFKVMIKL